VSALKHQNEIKTKNKTFMLQTHDSCYKPTTRRVRATHIDHKEHLGASIYRYTSCITNGIQTHLLYPSTHATTHADPNRAPPPPPLPPTRISQ
jgi:hypothetical protein